MANNAPASVKLVCPVCGQVYAAIAGSVRTCVGCKVALVPVKPEGPLK